MNKRPNPFQQAYHPQAPAFTPGQPPLPPGPPPSLTAPQYDYSAYWAAAAAGAGQPQPQPAAAPGTYPQWPQQPPQPPPPQPTPEQTALYANYGYGGAGPTSGLNWQQNRAPAPPPQSIPPSAPQYNPYQPQQPAYAPAPMPQQFGPPQYGTHMPPNPFYKPPQLQQQPQLQHSQPNLLPPAKRPRFDGPPSQPRFQAQPQLQMGPHQPSNNRVQLGATPMAPANFMNHTSIRGGGVMLSNNRGGNRGGRGGNMRGRVGMGRGNASVAPIRGPIPTQPRGGAPRGPAAFNRRGGYPMNTPSGPRPKNLPNAAHMRAHPVGVNEITRPDGTVRAWGSGVKIDKENAEGKRTLTDFRLIGFGVCGEGLAWSWGVTRPPKSSEADGLVKKEESEAESLRSMESTDVSVEATTGAAASVVGKESSRIRIYFHTPPHATIPRTNGKRKKPEVDDDEVDAEVERQVPAVPLATVPVSVPRSMSVDVPPSVSGTDGDEDGDWLMDAIGHDIDDPGEDSEVGQSGSVRSSAQPSDSTLKQSPTPLVREDSLFGSVSGGSVLGLNGPDQSNDLHFDDDDAPNDSHTPISESSPIILPIAPPLSSLASDETVANVAKEEDTDAHLAPLPSSAQVTSSEIAIPLDDANVIDDKLTPTIDTVPPPTSPVVVQHQPSSKDSTTRPTREAAGNRLSISYALSARRLVIDASVVESVKIFRAEGRIEIKARLEPSHEDAGIKGVLLEALSEATQQYEAVTLPSPTTTKRSQSPLHDQPDSGSDSASPGASAHPPLGVDNPQTVTFQIYLDLENPLSVPKWVKTGDVEEWLRSMFGNGPFVHGKGKAAQRDEDRGWVGKITVVDPDPPPTLSSIIETWGNNSLVGQAKERRWFLRNHLADIDNVLEILLRLVRGERATASAPLSQNSPAGSLSGPLLTALSPTSSHAAQQTHVSLAVMAMFRMALDLAERAAGDNDEKFKENRKYVEENAKEIIRCIPQHLIYKALDGMFREWTADKKNHKSAGS